jgi:hypothetical protein
MELLTRNTSAHVVEGVCLDLNSLSMCNVIMSVQRFIIYFVILKAKNSGGGVWQILWADDQSGNLNIFFDQYSCFNMWIFSVALAAVSS